MTTEELSSKFLTVIEGKRLGVYRDSKGILTAGIGHTGPDVRENMVVTPEMVADWFEKDQASLLKMVQGLPVLEAAMLVSFGFNCGAGALRRVLDGKAKLEDFIYAGKQPVLKPRRDLESALITVSRDKV